MKTRRLVGIIGAAAMALGVLATFGCSSGTGATATSRATTQTGTRQNATTGSSSAGSSAGQVLPVAQNPIRNAATKEGLQISSAMAENNVDPLTKKDLTDRLQFTIKNISPEVLTDPEVYYLMTDTTTKKTEGYYQKLTGFSLAPGADETVYFDNETGPHHYPENKYSLYRTSPNEVVISIEVSSPGYKPAMAQAVKAVGTGEKAGE